MSISVVIPVYNSQESLEPLIHSLYDVLRLCGHPFEVVLVNDGSQDTSWAVIERLALERPWILGINLMTNFGQHNALLCGIRAARYATVVTMDDDMQNPPEEVIRLVEALDANTDVVYGYPQREAHGLLRNLASAMTKIALRGAMGVETARRVSSFRAFRTQVRAAFSDYRGAFVSIDVLLTWGTRRFKAIPVRCDPRRFGVSQYSLCKLIVHGLNMVTGFTILPLQLASLTGFLFTFVGLILLLYVVGRYFMEGGAVPGFPFLASMIAIFSGAQLFALGIIGEYLARVHFRIMDRPVYTVRSTTADSGGNGSGDSEPGLT